MEIYKTMPDGREITEIPTEFCPVCGADLTPERICEECNDRILRALERIWESEIDLEDI